MSDVKYVYVSRLGKYKVSPTYSGKKGDLNNPIKGFKTSIPNEVRDAWNLPKFTTDAQDEQNLEIYIYAEERDGKPVLVISREPLPNDILGR